MLGEEGSVVRLIFDDAWGPKRLELRRYITATLATVNEIDAWSGGRMSNVGKFATPTGSSKDTTAPKILHTAAAFNDVTIYPPPPGIAAEDETDGVNDPLSL